MKKIISLSLIFLLVFSSIFCVPVSAASKSDDTFSYELSINKKYYILDDVVSKIKGSVKIPKKFNGLPVKEIGSSAFWDCDGITSVSIYSNIEKIGENAFGHCDKLSEIFVSDYVDYIHSTAFDDTAYYRDYANWVSDVFYVGNHFIKATGISGNYRIKEGTRTIAAAAFKGCGKLKAVILPTSIKAIHEYTFNSCSSLEHIYIPEGVESIGSYAFEGSSLKYVHLPSTLKKVGECAFPRMTAVYIPSNVTNISLWGFHSDTGMIFGEEGSYAQDYAINVEEVPFTPISEHTHNIETVNFATASVNSCGITFTKCDGCGQIFEYNVTSQKKTGKVRLTKIENGTTSVIVEWEKVTGADGYRVYRRNYGEDDWTLIEVVSTPWCLDYSVKNNKKYQYTVKAVNEAGTGASSGTKLTIKYVDMPEITGLVNNTDGVKISWEKVNYADRYYIYRFNEAERKWERIKSISGNKTFSYVDEDVKSSKRYYYKIKAYNDGYLSGDVGGGAPAIERLSTPKLSTVTSTKSGVKFTWKKVTGADAYIVYRKTGTTGKWKEIKTIEDGSTVSYTDKTAEKGKTYYYSVRASRYGMYKSAYNTTGLKIKDKY